MSQRERWNARYANAERPTVDQACEVLRRNRALLPSAGTALDLASGVGANALLLAEHGLRVSAWDISEVALDLLQQTTAAQSLRLETLTRNVEQQPPEPVTFDVIVVSRFLHRPTLPALATALKPGGLLFYQTFNRAKPEGGPSNPDFLLERGELLRVFSNLRLCFYQEYEQVGNTGQGNRFETLYVGQSPDKP
ncbi:2-polyprenyl-3-methyl-5-hydroxy-6-metoxy-1,4-benzoquinol methylase [Litorivivens lipolytica]|uniref:2-polyprenyl-3-methyl-5-hydroxy-6-metoxy-1, 4-benzoquinol methylase n=1 Tax=Litorivivens lipolytica TaxID=1524264 RepID=A0A7W4W712_9GAMM|nr:class I SAM-dependent methyltransferase [Litorivivens lipolytica]MBB3048636.1 2-polyprenyl-3-methyl-5-hydroxy-6-metoxy-1,4-benzoquinol methylase [Litorivivens lipolytica]